ncbi:hypothetical protein [Actinokineospora bangkokensis]|uniref:Uncharacterized protein n=1 Tax=Actinokineospora bangkokensis TaxID=1193682 RepID=A0A1Q9LD58_9PSEU|nr:hypothetical protein [Actinokineospora bangkokensis]OLR89968.1 hypothetical protein BJP25_03010 [Actinokineospora bangkokensis]
MTPVLLSLALFALVLWLLSRADTDLTRAPLAGPTHLEDRDTARVVAELRSREPRPAPPAPAHRRPVSARTAATARPATGSR